MKNLNTNDLFIYTITKKFSYIMINSNYSASKYHIIPPVKMEIVFSSSFSSITSFV